MEQPAPFFYLDPPLALEPLLPRAPRLRWIPQHPSEATLVTLVVEPAGRGLPVFEARGRANEKEFRLVRLAGGSFLALVAAPLNVAEVPVEVTVTAIDGTRITQTLRMLVASRDFPATRLSVDSRFTAPDEATLIRIAREQRLVRATLRNVSDEPLWRGAFILPLIGETTSPYGQRRLFNNQLRSRHTGHDIDGDIGVGVVAANSGRIVISRHLFFNGNAVFIDHGLGFHTGYMHLSELEVFEGQWVEKGERIGRVGATGRVTGPHLHWGLYLAGVSLDPLSLLEPDFASLRFLENETPVISIQ